MKSMCRIIKDMKGIKYMVSKTAGYFASIVNKILFFADVGPVSSLYYKFTSKQ